MDVNGMFGVYPWIQSCIIILSRLHWIKYAFFGWTVSLSELLGHLFYIGWSWNHGRFLGCFSWETCMITSCSWFSSMIFPVVSIHVDRESPSHVWWHNRLYQLSSYIVYIYIYTTYNIYIVYYICNISIITYICIYMFTITPWLLYHMKPFFNPCCAAQAPSISATTPCISRWPLSCPQRPSESPWAHWSQVRSTKMERFSPLTIGVIWDFEGYAWILMFFFF